MTDLTFSLTPYIRSTEVTLIIVSNKLLAHIGPMSEDQRCAVIGAHSLVPLPPPPPPPTPHLYLHRHGPFSRVF